ncbi:MAG: extracellular solute-binding protein [Hyphomicrobiaceae bacterium]|nr:extracellular solute-binding protein [Hyphomicrobiaceae bacterium]
MKRPVTSRLAATALTTVALAAAAFATVPFFASPAAADGVVNLYSSRHYDTDEQLYTRFTELTGITVNRIEDDADKLIERIRAEGQYSPADILITVDAGRLWRADEAGIFQPVSSPVLEAAIPADLRHPEGDYFGFSARARVIFYDTAVVSDPPETYADLADPKYEGMVCTRSSSNIYMLSLLASMIETEGEDAARAWAEGVWNNRARDPEGGDTDQLRALASGQCAIVVANTYYFARAKAQEADWLMPALDRFAIVFPPETHVNISGAGVVATAPNFDNAVRFLEYLVSPEAQAYFAGGNFEYPVVEGVAVDSVVAGLGSFERGTVNVEAYGRNQATAQAIYDAVGYR